MTTLTGAQLAHARKTAGLTLSQLAERTGVDRALLSRYEHFVTVPASMTARILPVLRIVLTERAADAEAVYETLQP